MEQRLTFFTVMVDTTTLDAGPQIGSLCPVERYNIRASHYTTSKLLGVGISIGLTRLFYQLRDAWLVAGAESSADALASLLDDAGLDHALALSQQLRAAGLNVETPQIGRAPCREIVFQYR